MKTLLIGFSCAVACLHLAACSCAVSGESYVPESGSRNIMPALVDQFAMESDFRRFSESSYRRGWVNMSYDSELGGLGFNGSFCSLPNELILTSPSEVFKDVSDAQREAVAWFGEKGIRLRKATSPWERPN